MEFHNIISVLRTRQEKKEIFCGSEYIYTDDDTCIYEYDITVLIEKNNIECITLLVKLGLINDFHIVLNYLFYIKLSLQNWNFIIAKYLAIHYNAMMGIVKVKHLSELLFLTKKKYRKNISIVFGDTIENPLVDKEVLIILLKIYKYDIHRAIQSNIMFGNIKRICMMMHYMTTKDYIEMYIKYIKENSVEIILCILRNKYIIRGISCDTMLKHEIFKRLEDFYENVRMAYYECNEIDEDRVEEEDLHDLSIIDWEIRKKRLDTVAFLIRLNTYISYKDTWKKIDKKYEEARELITMAYRDRPIKYLYNDTEEYKECTICYKEYNNKSLRIPLEPCGHCGYCQECIKRLVICPRCRADIKKLEEEESTSGEEEEE